MVGGAVWNTERDEGIFSATGQAGPGEGGTAAAARGWEVCADLGASLLVRESSCKSLSVLCVSSSCVCMCVFRPHNLLFYYHVIFVFNIVQNNTKHGLTSQLREPNTASITHVFSSMTRRKRERSAQRHGEASPAGVSTQTAGVVHEGKSSTSPYGPSPPPPSHGPRLVPPRRPHASLQFLSPPEAWSSRPRVATAPLVLACGMCVSPLRGVVGTGGDSPQSTTRWRKAV